MDITVHDTLVEELTNIVPVSKVDEKGRALCLKLKDVLPREQFEYAIRAMIGGRCIARENQKAYRKDATQKIVSAQFDSTVFLGHRYAISFL